DRTGGKLESDFPLAGRLDLLVRMPLLFADFLGDLAGEAYAESEGLAAAHEESEGVTEEGVRVEALRNRVPLPRQCRAGDPGPVEALHDAGRLVFGEHHPVAPRQDEAVGSDEARVFRGRSRPAVVDRESDAALHRFRSGTPDHR